MKSKMKAGWLHEEQDEGRLVACRASGRQAGYVYIQSKWKAGRLHAEQVEGRQVTYRASGRQAARSHRTRGRQAG